MNITKYIENLEINLKIQGKSKSTIEQYKSCLGKFLGYFDKSDPIRINESDIKHFLATLSSKSAMAQMHGCLVHFYKSVLKHPRKLKHIPCPTKDDTLPKCISRKEAKTLINSLDNIKHTAMLYLLYTSGLRRSELINLKIKDIESDRGLIRINQGKGNKDRYTLLTESCLWKLMAYYQKFKPKEYLFEGQFGGKYSGGSLVKIVKKAAKSIGKNVTPHQLRHSFATHLIEDGVPTSKVQKLLGHKSSKTTDIYIHLANNYKEILDLAA